MSFCTSEVYTGEAIPFIVYVHSEGLKEAFKGNPRKALSYAESQFTRIENAILQGRVSPSNPQYAILTVWGDTRKKRNRETIDAFVFGDIENWPGNPEFAAGVFRGKGILRLNGNNVRGCGDSLVMLGTEEEIRRRTDSLEEYVGNQKRFEVMGDLLESGFMEMPSSRSKR